MTDQPNDKSQKEAKQVSLFNPFAQPQVTVDQTQPPPQANMQSEEDYDDEEADFAQISDLIDAKADDPIDTQGKQMVTTAAFRMSTNDDLKKTANWSGMNQESPPDNNNKRQDWSAKEGSVKSKQAGKQNPTAKSSQLPKFGTPIQDRSQPEERLPEFGTPQQQSKVEISQTEAKRLKIVSNQSSRLVVGPKSSSSKIISASSIKFTNKEQERQSLTSKYPSSQDQTGNKSSFAGPSLNSTLNKHGTKQSSAMGRDGYRIQNKEPVGLIRSEQVKGNSRLQEQRSPQGEVHPFDLAHDASRGQIAGLEQSWDSNDPLQQTFAHMNTSEAIANELTTTNSVNPFCLNPPILIEQVSNSPDKTKLLQGKMQPADQPSDFITGIKGTDTNSLMVQQIQERGAFGGMKGHGNNNPDLSQRTKNAADQLKLSKQQHSAATALRQHRFSLGGSSINGSTNAQEQSSNKGNPSGRFSNASKKAPAENAQNEAVYRIKNGQINQMTAATAKGGQSNAMHGNSRDRLVTGTTAAGSSENMFSRSSARRGSAQRQNSNVPNQQRSVQQRQNPLIQSGANLLKPIGQDSQQPTSPSGSAASGQVIQGIARQNNQQMRGGPILAGGSNVKEFQDVFSPNNLSVHYEPDDVKRVNSQQWQNSPNITLFTQQASQIQQQIQQTNLASPHAASQGAQQMKAPRASAGKFQLGGNPFEQAAKLGLIAPDDPRLNSSQQDLKRHPLSPKSIAPPPGSLDSFMRIRLSEDHQDYEAQMNDPSSPLYNKKAQTAVKGDIKQMITGAYSGRISESTTNNLGRNQSVKFQMQSQPEMAMGSGLRAQNHIQSAGNPFGSTDGSYVRAQQADDAHAQALFRKISSQGLMQPSHHSNYPNEFDKYYQTLNQQQRQQQVDHFPPAENPMPLQLQKVAQSANHILIGDQKTGLHPNHIKGHHHSESRHSGIQNQTNASFSQHKGSQGPVSNRPIASKNMPQCFRPAKRPHAAAQGAQHARAASMGESQGTQGNPTSSASKRCFSNDARFVQQQNPHAGLNSAGGIQQHPGYMIGSAGHQGNAGMGGQLGVHQAALHTAQVNKRTSDQNNYNASQFSVGGGLTSVGGFSNMAPQTATKNQQAHGRDLQQIHESFPAFELQQKPTSPSAGPNSKPGSQRLWQEQDPFKQSM